MFCNGNGRTTNGEQWLAPPKFKPETLLVPGSVVPGQVPPSFPPLERGDGSSVRNSTVLNLNPPFNCSIPTTLSTVPPRTRLTIVAPKRRDWREKRTRTIVKQGVQSWN